MLIFKKYSIKTCILSVLFMMMGYQSYAKHSMFNNIEWTKNMLTAQQSQHVYAYSTVIDSIIVNSGQKDSSKLASATPDIIIPEDLANSAINFRINSYINYLHLNHFIYPESKRLFILSWLKERELQKLSLHTDSLRKAYSSATSEEREKISNLILQSEEKYLALLDEIPVSYEKAREEENNYWQSASMDEITRFQQKISSYQDSISAQNQHIEPEELDTITMYVPSTYNKEEENKAEAPDGIIYKIQIGAFKGKIPDATNKLIKKLSIIRKVENHVDDKGVKVYTTGNLRSYTEAETMLSQVKQEGVKNATITAYQNGKKINIIEARKLNK